MPDEALGVVHREPVAVAEHLANRQALFDIPLAGRGGMAAENIDVIRLDAPPPQGETHAFRLPLCGGEYEVAGVRIDPVADDLAVNLRSAVERTGHALQRTESAPLGHHD